MDTDADRDADLATVAGLIGDPTRARVLTTLGDGRALAASVLAAESGVAPSTVSGHLRRLVDGGLLTVRTEGRHRYYQLAGPEIAEVIEALARIAPPAPVRSLKEGTKAHAVRRARSCYDHLAGRLGVQITRGLRGVDAIRYDDQAAHEDAGSSPAPLSFGPAAEHTFSSLGVDLVALRNAHSRRPLLRLCIDWSEREPHLAGATGGALLDALLRRNWVARRRTGRALGVTEEGHRHLHSSLSVR